MEIDYLKLPPPKDPPGRRGSARGVVKWYKNDKGYGCISCDVTRPWDIWCHVTAVEGRGVRALEPGQTVAVNYQRRDQDSFRYVATRVVAIPTGDER